MIKFGTGGWRAIIADGFTKENIRLLTAGLCALMEKEGHAGAEICVGYDRRFLSKESAHWACEVLAGYGFRPYVINRSSPTPLIMFTVKRRNMPYGMAVTASHNPAIYNGIKVFTEGGRDADAEVTRRIEAEIEKVMAKINEQQARLKELEQKKLEAENSEIVEDTVDVVFESANFNGTSIRRTALALGMRTEASAKFEKGLDILNTLPAVNRACELVEMLGAGEVLDGTIDILNFVPQPKQLKLRADKINALLGTDIDAAEMCRILQELGFGVDGDIITVPSWRGDVEHYSDLAEEVARFYGYNQIPTTAMTGVTTRGGYSPEQMLERSLGTVCRSLGYDEIITYSFISPTYYDKIRLPEDSPLRKSMKIMNPLGEDTSIMRTTVMPSMLEILTRNYNYRNKEAHLYELGRTYFEREDGMADEPKHLSLGVYGPEESFFTLKGAVETILDSIRAEDVTYVAEKSDPSYHPGRCAKVYVNGQEVGTLGQIHPLVAANYGVDAELYYADLKFDALFASRGADPEYQPLPKFPAVTRDIAVLVDKAVTVGAMESSIQAAAKGLLKDVTLFDIYEGAKLPTGKISR